MDDVTTSNVIRYLRVFQLCTIFCISLRGFSLPNIAVKMSNSGSESDIFHEEQDYQRSAIQPYQFEPRVNSDEADSNAEDLPDDESMESGDELNSRLENSDWYVVAPLAFMLM